MLSAYSSVLSGAEQLERRVSGIKNKVKKHTRILKPDSPDQGMYSDVYIVSIIYIYYGICLNVMHSLQVNSFIQNTENSKLIL